MFRFTYDEENNDYESIIIFKPKIKKKILINELQFSKGKNFTFNFSEIKKLSKFIKIF